MCYKVSDGHVQVQQSAQKKKNNKKSYCFVYSLVLFSRKYKNSKGHRKNAIH